MWRYLAILTILFTLFSPVLGAEKVLVGTIVSVDRELGQLVVKPLGGGRPSGDTESGNVTLNMPSDNIGGYVQPGMRVRIWMGGISDNKPSDIRINPMRGGPVPGPKPPPPRPDPTGVRSRLMHRPAPPLGHGPPGGPGGRPPGGPGGGGGRGGGR